MAAILLMKPTKPSRRVSADSDWCVYIQGDEVMHENGHDAVMKAMQKWKDDKEVDGLLFKYVHFFGSYDYIGIESKWYRNEIRVIRNDKSIWSYRDAQGFRKGDNKKLQVKPVDAYIHHYGWVQTPEVMRSKVVFRDQVDPNEEKVDANQAYALLLVKALEKFKGTHPSVMQKRIAEVPWKFEYDVRRNSLPFNDRCKNLLEKITGRRFFDYRNYTIV